MVRGHIGPDLIGGPPTIKMRCQSFLEREITEGQKKKLPLQALREGQDGTTDSSRKDLQGGDPARSSRRNEPEDTGRGRRRREHDVDRDRDRDRRSARSQERPERAPVKLEPREENPRRQRRTRAKSEPREEQRAPQRARERQEEAEPPTRERGGRDRHRSQPEDKSGFWILPLSRNCSTKVSSCRYKCGVVPR